MDSARATRGLGVWALSVILAAVFLLAGVPKILGTEPLWLQAAAMHGFPSGMRVVVGICEVLGALAQLVPTLTIYGAIGLAVLMVPATITQAMSGEPGLYVPIIVCVLLLLVAWQRDPVTMRALS